MENKKKIVISLLIFILALQIGCTQKINENSITNQDSKEKNGILEEYNTIIEQDTELDQVIIFINENISLLSEEQASIMINRLEEIQEKNLVKLEEKFVYSDSLQNEMFKLYNTGFDIDITDNVDNEDLKALLTEIRDNGYKVETAEGMFFLIINYEFYKKYSPYVTPDMKVYIDIMSVESNKVPAKDAALVIGWDEVLDRALSQEKFINQYPDSVKINDVKGLYKKYISFALFGLDNTPLFSYESNTMLKDVKNIYINKLNDNVESNLMNTLRGFLEVLQKNNYRLTEEVEKYREAVMKNIL